MWRFHSFWTDDTADGPFRGSWRPAGWEPWGEALIVWPVVLLEQALVVLIGGGLLTAMVRRERRRRPPPPTPAHPPDVNPR